MHKKREYFCFKHYIINSTISSFHPPTQPYFTKRMLIAVSPVTNRGTELWRR